MNVVVIMLAVVGALVESVGVFFLLVVAVETAARWWRRRGREPIRDERAKRERLKDEIAPMPTLEEVEAISARLEKASDRLERIAARLEQTA